MKILFVLEHYYPYIGGVENMFTQLAESLVNEGHKVSVVTSRHNPDLPIVEQINGVEVHRLRLSNRFLFTFFGLFGIIKYARQADIIHTSTYNAAFPAFFAGLFTRRKIILTFHEYWGGLWFRLPYLSFISRILFWTYEQIIVLLPFSRIVAVSHFTANRLLCRYKAEKITTIYNGLKYDELQWHRPEGKFTYTYFGRLGVSKGLDIILAAAQIFSAKNPDSRLQMIIPRTPKSFYKTILHEIEEKELGEHIKLFHELSRKDLQKTILSSHCVVIPSYSEGFCFAAAESVAMQIPVISSQKGALSEVVSGTFIAMPSHDAQGLVQALQDAKNDKWTHTPIRRFELDKQIEQYLDYYRNL